MKDEKESWRPESTLHPSSLIPHPSAHPSLLAGRTLALFRILAPFLGLFLVVLVFGLLAPKIFLTLYNFKTVAIQTVIVALGALGMTIIIISGGIDLSIGSVIALVTVVIALMLQKCRAVLPLHPATIPLMAAAAGVLTGIFCGFINGILITGLRIVSFIATLGTMGIARGVAKYLAQEQKIDAPSSWLGSLMQKSPDPSWLLLGVWIMLVASLVVAVILRSTLLGRYAFAIGSNEVATRLCGVAVERYKVIIYSLGGLFAGLAGLMQYSRLTVGDPTVAIGMELDIIAAVVIGGGSLSGGQGSVLGSLIGAFIMAFLRNGCGIVGVPNYVQEIIIGIIIITAVALDRIRVQKS